MSKFARVAQEGRWKEGGRKQIYYRMRCARDERKRAVCEEEQICCRACKGREGGGRKLMLMPASSMRLGSG